MTELFLYDTDLESPARVWTVTPGDSMRREVDCDDCRRIIARNDGQTVWTTLDAARERGSQNAREVGMIEGSYGYVSASGDSASILRWSGVQEPTAPEPDTHSLFVAVAMAGGVGGHVQYRAWSSPLRIVRCDPEETGVVWLTALSASDDGAVEFRYDTYSTGGVTVVQTAPEPPQVPARLIPRTSAEAQMLLSLLEGVGYQQGDQEHAFDSLRALVRFLPGGEAEEQGARLASHAGVNLCDAYEGVVVPVLGWKPRQHCASYERRLPIFEQTLATIETRHPAMIDSLREAARRYERGGEVNQAIVDHMRDHLESHKHEAANAVLEQFGMDGIEDIEREFYVDVRATRTIQIEVAQTISITVTASDADQASEMVDQYCIADYADDYGWEDENGSTHYASTRSGDIDDYDVYDVNEA